MKRRKLIFVALILAIVTYFGYREYQYTNDYYLFGAAATGDLQRIKQLIERGVQIDVTLGGDGETVLHRAVSYGRLEVVDYLIASGAD